METHWTRFMPRCRGKRNWCRCPFSFWLLVRRRNPDVVSKIQTGVGERCLVGACLLFDLYSCPLLSSLSGLGPPVYDGASGPLSLESMSLLATF